MSFMVVSFYTVGTPYEGEVQQLQATCEQNGLLFDFFPVPSTGVWEKNCGMKPSIILGAMKKYPKTDILYVDADARFRQYPFLFDNFDGDIGIHYRNGKELLSGTIFIHNTEKTRKLIELWVQKQELIPLMWDQKVLDLVLKESAEDLKIKIINLPAPYTLIFDTMAHQGPPVIEHMQASRRLKSNIPNQEKLPVNLDGLNLRWLEDGSFMLPQVNQKTANFLDKHFIRYPNELRWMPRTRVGEEMIAVEPLFKDKVVFIIGKGPSLDHLGSLEYLFNHFSRSPIIGINEAVHQVTRLQVKNPIFAIQQDTMITNTCMPSRGMIFIHERAAAWYSNETRKILFSSRLLGLKPQLLTLGYAIKISQVLGARMIVLCCFDGSVTLNCDYAQCIGYGPNDKVQERKERFISHIDKMQIYLGEIPSLIIIPEALGGKVFDKRKRLLGSLEEHHVDVQLEDLIALQSNQV